MRKANLHFLESHCINGENCWLLCFSPKQGRSCEFFHCFILRGNLMIHLKERRNSSDSNPTQRTASDWGWTTQNPKFKWTRNYEGLGPRWGSVLLKKHARFVVMPLWLQVYQTETDYATSWHAGDVTRTSVTWTSMWHSARVTSISFFASF